MFTKMRWFSLTQIHISVIYDLENFHVHLAETMADLGFYDPENPKQLLTRMRRLFNRQRMDKMEVSILRGLLSSVQRIINK